VQEIYDDGFKDMQYVALVNDKNLLANPRINEYNLYGYPTMFWDGGYEVDVGAGSVPSAKNTYLNSISQCELRNTADLDVDVRIQWCPNALGQACMNVTVSITNNEATPYNGRMLAYACEYETTLGWIDSGGAKCTHPFLAYAFDETLSIPAGGTWEKTAYWAGASFNTGYGQNFGGIKYYNTFVTAAVFNDTWHQGYAYPPSSNPFDAYYLDAVSTGIPDNLSADTYDLPEGGGTVNLGLYPGFSYRARPYLIVGGVSGTSPGFPLPGGLSLPINWDVFSDIVMGLVNSPVFMNFMGKTSGDGSSQAQINAPALPPGSAGLVMYYAYCLGSPFDFVSIPIEITVVP
jgi:hypothetical protein